MPQQPAPIQTSSRKTQRPLGRGLHFALVLPALILVGVLLGASTPLGSSTSSASAVAGAAAELAPNERQRKVSRLVGEMFERSHYSQLVADEKFSSKVFDHYLQALDMGRSYFLQSDIEEFEPLRPRLAEAVRTGAIDPAFVIFKRLVERNRAAITSALQFLDVEPDFTVDESFAYDRTHADWPKTQAELNDLWRKRVKNDALSLMLTGKTWIESRDILRKRYDRLLKRVDQVSNDDVFETFLNAYAHVYDPHSNYFTPRSSEEYNIAMKLSYVGIGASLQLIDDYVTIMNVIPGSPVAVGGQIKANDRITAVGQNKTGEMVDVIGWRLDDVVQKIRGPAGTVVRLSILPAGATPGAKETILEFVRNKVTLEAQAAKKKLLTIHSGDRDYKIGVIDVPSFYQDSDAMRNGEHDYRSTTRDVAKLIAELKKEKIDGLVMDLRGDGGGLLTEATGLVGLFIKRGPVVQLRKTGNDIEVLNDPEPGLVWDGPMAVLVDRTSASASEIFSAAMQDYGRAVIIGQDTYGKGTVQNLYPLDHFALGPNAGFGELTVTIGKYYRITGESVQNKGVIPEIALPSAISTTEIGESTRDTALPWDRIRPVTFEADHHLNEAIPVLLKKHEERLKSDPDLMALASEVRNYEMIRSEKTISLDLAKRKAQREADDSTRLNLINTRRAAHQQPPLESLEKLTVEQEPDTNLDESAHIVSDLIASETRVATTPTAPVRAQTRTGQQALAAAVHRSATAHH